MKPSGADLTLNQSYFEGDMIIALQGLRHLPPTLTKRGLTPIIPFEISEDNSINDQFERTNISYKKVLIIFSE